MIGLAIFEALVILFMILVTIGLRRQLITLSESYLEFSKELEFLRNYYTQTECDRVLVKQKLNETINTLTIKPNTTPTLKN